MTPKRKNGRSMKQAPRIGAPAIATITAQERRAMQLAVASWALRTWPDSPARQFCETRQMLDILGLRRPTDVAMTELDGQ